MKYDKTALTDVHGNFEGIEKNLYSLNPGRPFQKTFMNLEDLKIINRRYMGGGMSQNYASIYWQEYFFEAHRFQYVVEFGSQKGALSTYFANMAAITEAFFFETYELEPQRDWYTREYEGCGHWYEKLAEISPYINYHHQDIFSDITFNHVKENMEQFERTYIFCDGGNKIQEFHMYAPLLKKGDRIAVHDWNLEIAYPHIQSTVEQCGLISDEPYASSATILGTTIMPFRKV